MNATLRSVGAAELALRMTAHRGHGDWSALVVNTATGDVVEEAAAELGADLSEVGGLQAERVRAGADAMSLVTELAQHEGPAILTGVDAWPDAEWQHLDELRSRLLRDERTVLVLSKEAFDRLVANAPNLGSFIPSAWAFQPDADQLTEEARERRLVALRAWSGMTDDEMLDRRRRGVLPPDPEFSLWLILLDRGDLLASGNP